MLSEHTGAVLVGAVLLRAGNGPLCIARNVVTGRGTAHCSTAQCSSAPGTAHSELRADSALRERCCLGTPARGTAQCSTAQCSSARGTAHSELRADSALRARCCRSTQARLSWAPGTALRARCWLLLVGRLFFRFQFFLNPWRVPQFVLQECRIESKTEWF